MIILLMSHFMMHLLSRQKRINVIDSKGHCNQSGVNVSLDNVQIQISSIGLANRVCKFLIALSVKSSFAAFRNIEIHSPTSSGTNTNPVLNLTFYQSIGEARHCAGYNMG
ncbi:MAG: hypothetical protein M3M88_00395 [Thermoproteota archaeon]|nr:hypothetical protein [Thermoproteota archaeon]